MEICNNEMVDGRENRRGKIRISLNRWREGCEEDKKIFSECGLKNRGFKVI